MSCTTFRMSNAFKCLPHVATLEAFSLCNYLNLQSTCKALQLRVQNEMFWCPSVLSEDILNSNKDLQKA